ncbi:MAG: MAPEG family protein [Saezia sp.]
MNLAFFCIILACFMPLSFAGLAKMGGGLSGRPYDNHDPRRYLATISGWPQRAQNVQLNSWEALPIFIAAVLMASIAGVPQATIDGYAVAFILIRLVYGLCYLLDWSTCRTIVWSFGFFACLRLMVAAL